MSIVIASDEPSKVGVVELDVKENEPENIEEIVVKLVLENGTTVEKKIENPTDKKIDLLKPFDDVELPVKVQKIVVIIKKKYVLKFLKEM